MKKKEVLDFLKLHYDSFYNAKPYGDKTLHPTPSDSRSWSQILVSLLTGINGMARGKGADLSDGSDVKAANTWDAIDTPRFNGVLKAGTKSLTAGTLHSLKNMPYLFFVLWDKEPKNKLERCRVWVVRTRSDKEFRKVCRLWYAQRDQGKRGNNFQLHPPRGKNSNLFTNSCGNLDYPLLLSAVWNRKIYRLVHYDPKVLQNGVCSKPKN